MNHTEEIAALNERLNMVIRTRCDPIGCKDCDLKHGGFDSKECSATELNGRIMDLELKQYT